MGSISHLRSLVRSLAGCHLTIGMRPVLVAIMIFFGLTPLALAGSGEPAATISAPQTVQLGSTFSFSVSFDNTSSDTTGFGPFVDVAYDATGPDGIFSSPYDGLTASSTVNFLGSALPASYVQSSPLMTPPTAVWAWRTHSPKTVWATRCTSRRRALPRPGASKTGTSSWSSSSPSAVFRPNNRQPCSNSPAPSATSPTWEPTSLSRHAVVSCSATIRSTIRPPIQASLDHSRTAIPGPFPRSST